MESAKPKKKISIALTIVIVLAAVALTYFILSLSPQTEQLDCKEMNIFYTEKITLGEAKEFKNYILGGQELSAEDKKSILLDKDGDVYIVKFVINKGYEADEEYVDLFKVFAHQLSKDVFKGNPVRIELCEDDFDPILVIEEYDIK